MERRTIKKKEIKIIIIKTSTKIVRIKTKKKIIKIKTGWREKKTNTIKKIKTSKITIRLH